MKTLLTQYLPTIKEYWQYPSTKKGIAGMFSVIGVAIAPEYIELILVIGGAVISAIEIFTSDADVKKESLTNKE